MLFHFIIIIIIIHGQYYRGQVSRPVGQANKCKCIAFKACFLTTFCLTCLVKTKSNHVRVDHGQVEGSEEEVAVSDGQEHGAVRSWVALVDFAGRLVGVTGVVASDGQRSVSEVELANPGGEHGVAGGGGGDVGVVGANGLAGSLPGQVDELAREREGLGAVADDAGCAAVPGVLVGVDTDARLVGGNGRVSGVSNALARDLVGLSVVGRETIRVGLVHDVKSREVPKRC